MLFIPQITKYGTWSNKKSQHHNIDPNTTEIPHVTKYSTWNNTDHNNIIIKITAPNKCSSTSHITYYGTQNYCIYHLSEPKQE